MSNNEVPTEWRSGTELQGDIRSGLLLPLDAVESTLARIALRDPMVRAWSAVDGSHARDSAGGVDPAAPLAGYTVGVKDIIDVRGYPTTCGSSIYERNFAARDAACIARLGGAGAVMLGKTVTCEFAAYAPGVTENPHKLGYTPGGSSSGSAAAVADGQATLALGTQTAGSIVRPASFCGVLGFKPSYGRYPLDGVKPLAVSFDTLGLFARSFDDLLSADAVLTNLADTDEEPRPGLVVALHLPWDDRLSPAMAHALETSLSKMRESGVVVRDVTAPSWLAEVEEAQSLVMAHEATQHLSDEIGTHWEALSPQLQGLLSEGLSLSSDALQSARRVIGRLRTWAEEVFSSASVIVTPSAAGAAPQGLGSTGDPVYCRPWSATGHPTISMPVACDSEGLPLGAQFIGRRGEDRTLIRTTRHLSTVVGRPFSYIQD